MTSSDIIAVVAIVVSAIVSTLSLYISYKNNKSNILAKRTEIALEKQLEAFSILEEKMHSITTLILSTDEKQNSAIDKAFRKKLEVAYNNFLQKYDLLRIYLPPHLEIALDHFDVSVLQVLLDKIWSTATEDEQDNYLRKILLTHSDVISSIRKYIGIESGK
jgi:hypothetical protein